MTDHEEEEQPPIQERPDQERPRIQTYINRVSVKPPVFYRSNPNVWFRQMESQFVLAHITDSVTKFHHILGAIPEDVAINLPTGIVTYENLKAHIFSNAEEPST
jgi:hypothetical protein